MKASLHWMQEMAFTCDNHGLKLTLDASPEHGGKDLGPSPKELVLNAMMGCTAMDVVSILKKMRQTITEFKMEVSAEKTLEHPTHFKTATLFFNLKGPLEKEKVLKALHASLTQYCGVNYMISKTCQISYHLTLNDIFIEEGPVHFIEPKQES